MNPNVKFKAERLTPFQARRKWLTAFAAGAGSLALAGCDRAVNNPRIDATLRTIDVSSSIEAIPCPQTNLSAWRRVCSRTVSQVAMIRASMSVRLNA